MIFIRVFPSSQPSVKLFLNAMEINCFEENKVFKSCSLLDVDKFLHYLLSVN